MALGVVGDGGPCHVARWVECAENNAVLKKIEWTFRKFVLVFEIWPFKFWFFVFYTSIFQSILGLNGLNKPARFLFKYVWPFVTTRHERVKILIDSFYHCIHNLLLCYWFITMRHERVKILIDSFYYCIHNLLLCYWFIAVVAYLEIYNIFRSNIRFWSVLRWLFSW